jgi:alpha-tubulin suppressor-like RCC1 family protein
VRCLGCSLLAGPSLLLGCGIEAIPCEAGCSDETTRIVCDADGRPRTEACPTSSQRCAAPACRAGVCSFEPAVGLPCGESNAGQCNEGFACMGSQSWTAAAHRHTCVRTDDGRAWCWGDNAYGQLGDGTNEPGLHPVLVRGLPDTASTVQPGYAHTCALVRSHDVYCWGDNRFGQCGVSPSVPLVTEPVRVPVSAEVRFTRITAGQEHTCAITQDERVYCWGNSSLGQCGRDPAGALGHAVQPALVRDLDRVRRVAVSKDRSCAVRFDRPTLKCWGSNSLSRPSDGQSITGKLGPGAGDRPYSALPVAIDVGEDVLQAAIGADSTHVVTGSGAVLAWGRNERRQLGTESEDDIVLTPAPVMIERDKRLVPLTGVDHLIRADGSDHCAVTNAPRADGVSIVCWGTDDWGELGAGTAEGARTTRRYPVPAPALPSYATEPTCGKDHACGEVVENGRPQIWCYGRPGMLGNGSEPVGDDAPPTQWLPTPVVWDPANFMHALE